MATVNIPDEVLREAGWYEGKARIEFACWLFDSGRLGLWPAPRLAGLDRPAMEDELQARGIAIFGPTLGGVTTDLDTLKRLEG